MKHRTFSPAAPLCALLLLLFVAPVYSQDKKVTQLTEDAAPTFDDLLITVDDPAGTPANKKAKLLNAAGRAVNSQTGTTYTVLTSDFGKLVAISNASAVAVTLPQANSSTFPAKWYAFFQNRGAGAATITPTTSTIDGAASLALAQHEGALVVSDGTNYFTFRGKVAGVGTGAISDDAVTNAKLADMATARIKGRTTAGTGDPEDLTAAQVKALLAITGADISNTPAGNIAATTVQAAINELDTEKLTQAQADALYEPLGGGGGDEDNRSLVSIQHASVTVSGLGPAISGATLSTSASGTLASANDADGVFASYTTSTTLNNAAGFTISGGLQDRLDTNAVHIVKVKTGASIADVRLWLTMTGGSMSASDTPSQHYFGMRYSTSVDGTAFWRFVSDNGSGTPEVTATAQAIAADTAYNFKFVTASGQVACYVYTGGAWSLLATHSTKVPANGQSLNPRGSATTLTTAAKAIKFSRWLTWLK